MEKKDVVKKRNPEDCMQNSAASLPHAPSSVFPAHAAFFLRMQPGRNESLVFGRF